MTRKLTVGAAKLCISPTPDMFPVPVAIPNAMYEEVKEGQDLHVRAIVADNGEKRILFVAFEAGGVPFPEELLGYLKESYGFEAQDVLLSATHCHSMPRIDHGNNRMKYLDPASRTDNMGRFATMVLQKAVEAVGLALKTMRPAKVGYGEGKSYLNINRDQLFYEGYWMQGQNWEGPSDKTLAVVEFKDEQDNVIAAILNYACHSITNFVQKDFDGKYKVSGDFPAVCCDWLERHFGSGAVIAWQSGAAGNQNPVMAFGGRRYDLLGTNYSDFSSGAVGASYINCVTMGEQHAIDALKAMEKITFFTSDPEIKTYDGQVCFKGQKFPEGIDRAKHRWMVDNIALGLDGWKPGEPLHKELAEMIPTDDEIPARTQLIVVGDTAFYGFNAELYNEIGVLCKEMSPFKHTIVTTHTGVNVGYILDDASKDHKVFQYFGNIHHGESNKIVTDGMMALFNRYYNGEE